jgi:hypothetical protein
MSSEASTEHIFRPSAENADNANRERGDKEIDLNAILSAQISTYKKSVWLRCCIKNIKYKNNV